MQIIRVEKVIVLGMQCVVQGGQPCANGKRVRASAQVGGHGFGLVVQLAAEFLNR